MDVADRKSIGFNTNENDVKIRDNRAVRYKHFGIVGGTGNIITGNHFFQGDGSGTGERSAGRLSWPLPRLIQTPGTRCINSLI